MHAFIEKYDESQDLKLVEEACGGSTVAMERLVKLHQRFIYNVALKFVRDADDAADLTQEILIKMITKLSLYSNKSNFRTWLYRMVMNHFISSKRKNAEKKFYSFEEMGIFADVLHNDEEMSIDEQTLYSEYVTKVRNDCMSSMLLCLNRQQRVIFILGGIFNIKSSIGGSLLGITPENFRKQLSRAKNDLFQFMNQKCGLINPDNPCRCHKKTKGFINEGKINPATHTFTTEFAQSILEVSNSKNDELDILMEGKYMQFFTSRIYEETNIGEKLIESVIFDPEIKRLFHLN